MWAAWYNQAMRKKPITAGDWLLLIPQLFWFWIAGWVLTISDLFVKLFRRRAPR